MATISDAISVTGATSGQAITEYQAVLPVLTGAQKTSLASLITAMGVWPGNAAHIQRVNFFRPPGAPGTVSCIIEGFIVFADGNASLVAKSADDKHNVLGRVP